MAELKKDCKRTDAAWKEVKNNALDEDTLEKLRSARRSAQKDFRRAQRVQVACDRQNNLNQLQQADENDKNLFYSLIKKQRKTNHTTTKELIVNNHLYVGDLLPAWEEHFSRLATPTIEEHFTQERFNRACQNIENIRTAQRTEPGEYTLPIPITRYEVKDAISSLKKKKAKDGLNLVAEHLQAAKEPITNFLTPVVNRIIDSSDIPEPLNEGITHPIQKKGKQINISGNHRGITISSIITKVMDKISLLHQKSSVTRNKDDMQYGFSEGRSGVHAAFILNECINESREMKTPLYAASLDAQKAFDVLRHESLLDKLHDKGLTNIWWKLKDSSYRNLTTRVIWDARLSNPIKMKQGNRQGAFPSPEDYITYLDDNLQILDKSELGFHIGDISLISPTCADDIIILARSPLELQTLLSLVVTYANEEHYVIHPEKSVVIPFNIQSDCQLKDLLDSRPWVVNGNKLPVVTDLEHVGIQRELNSIDPTIATRTSVGRTTMYSLFSSGMHGRNGLPAQTALHLYHIYVMPRVLYGLEALVLSKPNITALELFQRSILRALLDVPDRTAIPALHILTGTIPMRRILDQRQLVFLHSLICQEGRLKELVIRQYVMKKQNSKSWIANIKKTLREYSLPSLPDLLSNTPTKESWKQTVKKSIHRVATRDLEEEAHEKTTLKFMNPHFNYKLCHPSIGLVDNPRQVTRAVTKARMLTGTYLVHKKAGSDKCDLCGESKDTITHLLLECHTTDAARQKYMPAILNSIPFVYSHRIHATTDPTLLTHLILDATHPQVTNLMDLPTGYKQDTEKLTRDFCYAVHNIRSTLVK